MKTAQIKIQDAVSFYVDFFKDDYKNFLEYMKDRGEACSMESDYFEAKVAEYPEILDTMFITRLDAEELKWFKTKKGIRWFTKVYPAFGIKFVSKI